MASPKTSTSIYIALVVSLGGFLYGFDASVISGVVGYIIPQMDLDSVEIGVVVSSPSFAAMISMLLAGTLSTYTGRKKILIYAALLYAISAIGSALAIGFWTIVIARMIGGLAFGAALVLAPLYIAEIAPAAQRGKLVAIQQLNLVIGLSVAYFTNYFLQNAMAESSALTEQNVWRWMLALEAIPAVVYFVMMFFVPRSPRWLLLKGYTEEAKGVLTKLFGDEKAEEERQQIELSIEESRREKKPFGQLIKMLFSFEMRLVLTIGLVIGIVQMITGINAIFFYANTIFEQSGVGKDAAFTQAVMVGVTFVLFTIIAMTIIDRFGRKPLLLAGLAGVVISLSIAVYGFSQATYTLTEESAVQLSEKIETVKIESVIGKTYSSDIEFRRALTPLIGKTAFRDNQDQLVKLAIRTNPILILVGILGFIASFAVSLGPVMWVLLAEIFPTQIRGLSISVIGFINSFTSFLVTLVFPWELENLGTITTFLIYIGFAVVGLIMIARLLPETKGKSLEELEEVLVKRRK
ncbi:MAG: sugar porter family MFS transporter [Cyclobacteriaceae bacterium]